MRYRVYWGILMALCLIHASVTYAQTSEKDITVQTDGYGVSKNDALLQAKRSAIEKGIGTVLISATEVKNYEVQKDVIITKTLGAVKSYTLLSERTAADGSYQVTIQATVSLSSIRKDLMALKILLESMDKPRMMVVVKEKNGKVAETIILDFLQQKGFTLVDAATVGMHLKRDEKFIERVVAGDAVAAAKLGAENGAEYLITGKMTKSISEGNVVRKYGMYSGQASIQLKVVNCSTAKVIASTSETAAFAHIAKDTAMTKAAEMAAQKIMDDKLFETIVASFQDTVNNGVALDVVIKDVPNFKTQKEIQTRLADLSNVVTVNKRRFTQKVLYLSVVFKGNADSFSEAADGLKIKKQEITITDIVGNRIEGVLK